MNKLVRSLTLPLMVTLLPACSQQPVIWDTNGAYQGREIWNYGNTQFHLPRYFWLNEKGEEVFWKKGAPKQTPANPDKLETPSTTEKNVDMGV